MNGQRTQLDDWLSLSIVLASILLAVCLLAACVPPARELVAVASTATSQQSTPFTNTPGSEETNTPNDKEVGETRVANFDATIAAEVTLSPKPPYTPIIDLPQTPRPATPTWEVGYAGGPLPENTYNPVYISCWYGTLRDKLLQVCAGHEQYGGDPNQGVIRIRVLEQDQVTLVSDDVYETPEKVGVVHIITADSNSVIVASEDNQHNFTFDIATRQWVSSPEPSPSASP